MNLNILSLNCQKNYNKNLSPFFKRILKKKQYDILLLQETTEDVLSLFSAFPEYKIVNNRDEYGRLSLLCIAYNSKKSNLESFHYKPILFDKFERQELKKPFQSFGIGRAILNFQKTKVSVGGIHLPSGFSRKRRLSNLDSIKKIMEEKNNSVITLFGGDFNFGFKSEVKKASNFMKPEYHCCTSDIGPTLDSYYTEANLPYSWVHMNDILRFLGGRMKLRTDHFFLDSETASKTNPHVNILSDRVSDHSPIEMIIKD